MLILKILFNALKNNIKNLNNTNLIIIIKHIINVNKNYVNTRILKNKNLKVKFFSEIFAVFGLGMSARNTLNCYNYNVIKLTEQEKSDILNEFIRENINQIDPILIEKLKNKVASSDIYINKNELVLFLENIKLEYRQEALTQIAFLQKEQIEQLEASTKKIILDTIDIIWIIKIGLIGLLIILIIWIILLLYYLYKYQFTQSDTDSNNDINYKAQIKILEEKVCDLATKLDKLDKK